MEIVLAWLFGCLVLWCLLRRFTRLRGGMAAGITLMAGSLPAWIALFSVIVSFSDGNVGLLGAVILLVLAGGTLFALGFGVMLLSALFGGGKKKQGEKDDASLPEDNGIGVDLTEKSGLDTEDPGG